jgi:type I phosphodiesterase/nucleotide pyrophosphatase
LEAPDLRAPRCDNPGMVSWLPRLAFALLLTAGLPACGDKSSKADGEPTPVGTADNPRYQDVLIISIDGLRSDALQAIDPELIPHFTRLLGGAYTLNARTDPDFTVTLPNHTGMITGRTVNGPQGHAWTKNSLPEELEIDIESNLGTPLESIFHHAQADQVGTALFATKDKFGLWPRTWNQEGQPPVIDTVAITHLDSNVVLPQILDYLVKRRIERDLVFVHFHNIDTSGHAHGWNLTKDSEYVKTVIEVDGMLGELFATIDQTPELAASTSIILTADHGGGVPYKSHQSSRLQWINYVIPFIVWGSDGKAQGELYALNPLGRRDPSIGMPSYEAWPPPVRNLDAGNAALSLLGIKPLVGSNVNAGQELAVR